MKTFVDAIARSLSVAFTFCLLITLSLETVRAADPAGQNREAAKKPKAKEQAQKQKAQDFNVVKELVIEVEKERKAFLLLPSGVLLATEPDAEKQAYIAFSTEGNLIQVNIEGIHNFPQEKEVGEKLWQTLTVPELQKMYREAGFALLPHERSSVTSLNAEKFPFTILFPTLGLLQVTEVQKGETFKCRLKLKLLDPEAKPNAGSSLL
ncbi:MAG: hypothetical protein ACO1QB_11425 [Verrucomicrobiales bacterium]